MPFFIFFYILFRLTPYTRSDETKGRGNVSGIIMNKAWRRKSVRSRLPTAQRFYSRQNGGHVSLNS